jgi:hypothetical protein
MKAGEDRLFRGPISRWSESPGSTPRPTARGAVSACPAKPNGSVRRAATAGSIPGVTRRRIRSGHGCFAGCNGGTTVAVGSFPEAKGPYGHLDLAGNVWEWCEDMYDPVAYTRPTASRGEPGSCEQILQSLDSLRKNKQQGLHRIEPDPDRVRARASRRRVQLRQSRPTREQPRAPPGRLSDSGGGIPLCQGRALNARESRLSASRPRGSAPDPRASDRNAADRRTA